MLSYARMYRGATELRRLYRGGTLLWEREDEPKIAVVPLSGGSTVYVGTLAAAARILQSDPAGSYRVSIAAESGISEIPAGAFAGCTSLTEIEIPDSVTAIAASAFQGCTVTVFIDQLPNAVPGAPWGAENHTVVWLGLYRRAGYIESTGTQGINTGYSCSSGSAILEADVEFTKLGSGDVNIFGTWDGGADMSVAPYFWVSPNESGTIRFNLNNMSRSYSRSQTWGSVPEIGVRYTIRSVFASNGTSLTINGDYFSGSGYGAGRPVIGLFQNGTIHSGHPNAKLYGAKITDGSAVVRHFFPVTRKSDGKPGLLDIINNQFYANAWSGDFIAGEVI